MCLLSAAVRQDSFDCACGSAQNDSRGVSVFCSQPEPPCAKGDALL